MLGAYQFLLDWHLDYYASHQTDKWIKNKTLLTADNKTYRLSIDEKKRILLNNIHGVDLDPQAVEVTKLSLLLKVVEDPGQLKMFEEGHILPNLNKNIKNGNALIGTDYFSGQMFGDMEEMKRVKPFDWKSEFTEVFKRGGFDAVIGNPPYGTMISKEQLEYFGQKYKHQDYQKDLYLLFLERYHMLLGTNKFLGVIISNTWLQSVNLQNIRKYLSSSYSWQKILHLPEKVFKAVVDTHVVVFQKNEKGVQDNDDVVVDFMKNREAKQNHILNGKFISKNGEPINIVANPQKQILFRKIMSASAQLSTLFSVYNGVKPFEVGKGKPPQTEKIAKEQPFVVEGKSPDKNWKPLLRGSLIQRYVNFWNNDYWILYGEWLAAPRDPEIFNAPKKIMVRQTGDSIIATIVEAGFVARNNMHIILLEEKNYQFEYLLGLMNSKLMDFAYSFINPEKGEALAEIKKRHVEQLPICTINFNDSAEKSKHDKMVSLVEQMLALHKSLAEAKTPQEGELIKRQITSTDKAIDSLVYELYGLSQEEIEIVEN